ncbi:MAG: hypothetical protein GY778_29430 [bacterium]|nr:hypothetical protein [bacterium]
MTKVQRLALIQRLVRRRRIATQSDLLRQLAGQGARVEQSTLSRDLAELHVVKRGGRYAVVAPPERAEAALDYAAVVSTFTTCGPHLIVLSTEVGQAQPVAVWIDRQDDPAITATLAGDDSIFIATRTRRAQVVALRRLTQWFGEKHE